MATGSSSPMASRAEIAGPDRRVAPDPLGVPAPRHEPAAARFPATYAFAIVALAVIATAAIWQRVGDSRWYEGAVVAASSAVAAAALLLGLRRQRQREQLLRARADQERTLSNLRGYAEQIVASMPAGLLVLSPDLRVLSANQSFLDAFRVGEEEVVGRRLEDVARAEGLLRRARDVLRNGVAQRAMLSDLSLAARREVRPALITLAAIPVAGDESPRLLLIVQDLAEEERREAARRAAEERFRDLFQGLDAIVWEADAASLKFSFVSPRAEAILGYPVARWLADDFYLTRIHPDDRDRVLRACRAAIDRGANHEIEYRAAGWDGHEVWLRDIVHVVPGVGGRGARLRGLTVDLTDRKLAEGVLRQTEDQLRQVQKMDAVGKLAAGIAHDFNNLLTVIRGEGELLLRRLAPGDPLRRNLEAISEASEQATGLTRQLLGFSRKRILEPTSLDLASAVGGIREMLRRLIGEQITLATASAPDLGRVRADRAQIEQMILNLAINARDAMPEGGLLTIRIDNADVDATAALARGVDPGAYVLLEVSDTGVGMDADTQAHLFEPFFTTKSPDKGTGLGLSTVSDIVKQSGGHITVDSRPGAGTVFRVYLPQVEEAADSLAPGAPPASAISAPNVTSPDDRSASVHRGETILLVEDAPRVREVVREILETSGYAVLEARHAAEALAIGGEPGQRIDLVVTDVVMPRMGGRELARRLTALRPATRVLYMSGYTDDDMVRHGVREAGIDFIAKPFTPAALAAKVREVLDRPKAKALHDEPASHSGAAARERDAAPGVDAELD